MPLSAFVVALLLTLSVGGGLALASQANLPGDVSSPDKLTVAGHHTSLGVVDEAKDKDPDRAKGRPTVEISGTLAITFTRAFSDVEDLADDPDVPGNSQNGLLAKLRAAEAAIERGKDKVAINKLGAFLNQLDAMQSSGHISETNYNVLYSSYAAIVQALGGTPSSPTPPAMATGSETGRKLGKPASAPERSQRPEKDLTPAKNKQAVDSDDDAAADPVGSEPDSEAAKPGKGKGDREPGSGRPASSGKSGKSK